ncbi:MAG: ABC transporter substrate-binding protein [Salinigranum sp.]
MPHGEKPGGLDRRGLLRALGATGVAALAGCAGDRSGGTTSTGTASSTGTTRSTGTAESTAAPGDRSVRGTYTEAVSSDAKSLNFLYHSDSVSAKFVDATMDAAYDFRGVGEIVPLWVEDVTDRDKRVWTYTLRDNLHWSDPYGQLTAEDWVYTVRNLYQGENNWAGIVQYSDWKTTDENGKTVDIDVEETGKLTFEVRLPTPQPSFLADTAMWAARCLPKELVRPYVEAKDDRGLKQDEELNSLSYTGNLGPYDFVEWKREDRFVAERSDDYYLREVAGDGMFGEEFARAPYFEEYRLKVLSEQSTRLSALKNGDLTFYENVPSDKVAGLRSNDALKFRFPPNPFCYITYYNQRANGWELLRKAAVRRALSTAVDKASIVDNLYRGFPTVAHTFQPGWSPWYESDEVREFGVGDSYSHSKARSMLADATASTDYGYDGDALVGPDGEQVSLRMVYVGTSDLTRTVAEYFRQELAKVGIAVEPTNGGPLNTVQTKYLLNNDGEGDPTFNGGPRDAATSQKPWDLLFGVALNAYPIDPSGSDIYWKEGGAANFFGYVPEAPLAEWYRTAKTTTDEGERRRAFARIFGALSREQPADFLFFSVFKNAYKKNYMGMPAEGEYGYLDGWNRVTWYLE